MRYLDVRHSPLAAWQLNAVGVTYPDASGNLNHLTPTTANAAYHQDIYPGLQGLQGNAASKGTGTHPTLRLTGAMTVFGIMSASRTVSATELPVVEVSGAGETEADNTLWSVRLLRNQFRWYSESGAGVDAGHTFEEVALPNTPTVWTLRRNAPSGGSSTVDLFINGKLRATSAAITTPTGGTTSITRLGGNGTTAFEGGLASIHVWGSALTDEQIIAAHQYALQTALGPQPNTTRYRGTPLAFWPFQNKSINDTAGGARHLSWAREPRYASIRENVDAVFLHGEAGVAANALYRAADAALQLTGDVIVQAIVVPANVITAAANTTIIDQVPYGTNAPPLGPITPTNNSRLYALSMVNAAADQFSAVGNERATWAWSANQSGASAFSLFDAAGYPGKFQVLTLRRSGLNVTLRVNGELVGSYTMASAPSAAATAITTIGVNTTGGTGGFAIARLAIFSTLSAEHETVNTNLAMGCDVTGPVVSNRVPASGGVDVAQTAPILFRAVDTETSVDELVTDIHISIDGAPEVAVMLNGVFQAGYSGSTTPVAFGYDYVVNHAVEFPPGVQVDVRINVYDLMGNETEDTYSFDVAVSIESDTPIVESIGGTEIHLTGVPVGQYLLHLGPNGDETDPLCFAGAGLGGVVTSDGVTPVTVWTPTLPVGGPYRFFAVRVSGQDDRTVLSNGQITVVPYDYATGAFNLRRQLPARKWLWTGPSRIEEDEGQ